MKPLRPFAFLLGAVVLAELLRRADLPRLGQLLAGASLPWTAAALALNLLEMILKAERLRRLAAKKPGKLTRFGPILRVFLSGLPFAALTPAKAGDALRSVALSRAAGLPLPQAVAVHAADKVFDLAALGLLALPGLLFLLGAPAPAALASAPAAAAIWFPARRFFSTLSARGGKRIPLAWMKQLVPEAVRAGAAFASRDFGAALRARFPGRPGTALPALLTLAAWTCAFLRAWCAVRALSLPLEAFRFLLLLPAAVVIELLPFSVLGFGTREAALVILFRSETVTLEALLSLSFLLAAVGPLFSALCGVPTSPLVLGGRGRR